MVDTSKCPITVAVNILGGKWKMIIVYNLLEGTKRFNQLQRSLPGITQRTLTQQLRELEADGFIHREVYREVPPRVEYSMTELGLGLEPVIRMMYQWGEDYLANSELTDAAS